jgi:hypothetical protein
MFSWLVFYDRSGLCMSLLTLASTNQSLCLLADLMIAVQWLPKSRGLLPSTKPHSSSQNHIRRVAPSRVWAVGLLPESFWDRNGHGLWVSYHISPFPMRLGCSQWSLSCYAEVYCVNSVRIHGFRWNGRVEVSWKC